MFLFLQEAGDYRTTQRQVTLQITATRHAKVPMLIMKVSLIV